jgi:preprotein translocase subunit YajC
MLISPAYAQAAGGGSDTLMTFAPLVLIFVVFYFLLIRPQQKKAKTHREMLGNLRRGDRIVTNGGLIGKITRIPNEAELIIEIAEGIKVRVLRGMISEVSAKTERARDRKRDQEDEYDEDEDEIEEEEDYDDEDDDAEDGEDDDAKDEDGEDDKKAESK